jgi:hypothetical protein
VKLAAVFACSAAALIAVSIALVAFALGRYPGLSFVFMIFNLCCFGLVALIFPKPRLYVYTFLAGFLVLGFWLKVVIQTIWSPGFMEPVGDFSNTPEEWDGALLAASCGALGVIAVRCGHIWHAWKMRSPAPSALALPAWFTRWRRPVWGWTLVLLIGVSAANLQFAFYQTGVNPKLTLPMHINVVFAWLVNIGFALWIASLVWWDHLRRPGTLAGTLVLSMIEAVLSSVSAFSRLMYPLHAGPYWLAMYERRKELAGALGRRSIASLLGCFLVLLVLSILAVFWLRVYFYYGYASEAPPHAEPLVSHVERTVKKQVPALLVHRWVGLEGVLVVGAVQNRSAALLVEVIAESPQLAGLSLYQRVSKVHYLSESPEQFTFLGNAGPIAILLFSGSSAIVFAGMALIGLVLVLTEEAARCLTGNPFLLAVSGAALANVVSQTTYCYLTMIFLLQLWAAVGFLAAVQRVDFGNVRKGGENV